MAIYECDEKQFTFVLKLEQITITKISQFLSEDGENQQQTLPHMTPGAGIKPRPHWWDGFLVFKESVGLRRWESETKIGFYQAS